ncbi:hypothetical protein F4820DRAFT_11451 [Hypoxylon rubiginosum]|uniref:Uncharacterized protein n=1 Tax=Hypoxylon rubiginosum TaxID=110542 RepID=A0ACB9ZE37_9PEZI|nr:hypothetical protein F4820DRAFT_11451 [Hypoxylon rubiginosum]
MASSTFITSGLNLKFIDKGLSVISENEIIVILTTCQGTWQTSEFGRFLRLKLPLAYITYVDWCRRFLNYKSRFTSQAAGTCHMIPSQPSDCLSNNLPPTSIACLFASYGDGRRNYFRIRKPGRDDKKKVYDQIDSALARLREQLSGWGELSEMKAALNATINVPMASSSIGPNPGWTKSGKGMQIYMYQHNGSDFQASWPEVESLIRKHFAGWEGTWNIWTKLVQED